MENNSSLIEGGFHSDARGKMIYVNEFDMSQVRRFYRIEPSDTKTIRAWRAHKIEQRWFHVTVGKFAIQLLKIDNWETPSKNLPLEEYILSNDKIEVLHIPAGYASSVQAMEENSKLLVFADYGIENADKDNYLFPLDYFNNINKF